MMDCNIGMRSLFLFLASLLLMMFIFTTVSSLSPAEIQAIDDMYNAWPALDANYGWTNDSTMACDWELITCDENQTTIVELDVYNKDIVGTIPNSIGNLQNLTYLDLGYNALFGTIPASIGNLKNLNSLELAWNNFNGTIPASIENLKNLEYLSLYANSLTGTIPSSIGDLSKLNTLYLDDNQLSGTIPSTLGKLHLVKDFWLNTNQLEGTIPSSFSNLESLVWFHLEENQLTGTIPSFISNFAFLKDLRLDRNKLSMCASKALFDGNIGDCQILNQNENRDCDCTSVLINCYTVSNTTTPACSPTSIIPQEPVVESNIIPYGHCWTHSGDTIYVLFGYDYEGLPRSDQVTFTNAAGSKRTINFKTGEHPLTITVSATSAKIVSMKVGGIKTIVNASSSAMCPDEDVTVDLRIRDSLSEGTVQDWVRNISGDSNATFYYPPVRDVAEALEQTGTVTFSGTGSYMAASKLVTTTDTTIGPFFATITSSIMKTSSSVVAPPTGDSAITKPMIGFVLLLIALVY